MVPEELFGSLVSLFNSGLGTPPKLKTNTISVSLVAYQFLECSPAGLDQSTKIPFLRQDEDWLSCPNSAGTLRSESETERNPEVPVSPRGEALEMDEAPEDVIHFCFLLSVELNAGKVFVLGMIFVACIWNPVFSGVNRSNC